MFEAYKVSVMNKRIDAGVRWLDGYFGRDGWLGTINTQQLDLRSPNTCVIGQMFGNINQHMRDNFNTIIAKKLMTEPQAQARGFFLPKTSFLPWTPVNDDYSELTLLWVEKIAVLSRKPEPTLVVSPITREELTKKNK